MTQEITEDAAPHRWSARGVDGPVRPSASITIEPLDGGTGSRVTFTLDFAGHGIGVPLVRRQAQRSAAGELPQPQAPAGERSVLNPLRRCAR
jgi:hypothetical protein